MTPGAGGSSAPAKASRATPFQYIYGSWLDQPRTDEELKRWAKGVNAAAGYGLIDVNLFNGVQPHYTAAPILQGVHSPLVRRSGVRDGLDDAVALVLPEKPVNRFLMS